MSQNVPETAADETIRIRKARVHNLQDIDLDIPRNRLVVITGPSGSGKSSLAFDTLFAEGQRQYIESLSVYARQFLHQLERPDVDLIEGLQPTISIDQRAGSSNPRSTVATVTEVYDYLRLLMARLGDPRCFRCGEPIRQQTPEQILDELMHLPEGTKLMVLAPMVRGRKGEHKEAVAAIRKAGFLRARVDGEVIDVEHAPVLVGAEVAPHRGHRGPDRDSRGNPRTFGRIGESGGQARRWPGAGDLRRAHRQGNGVWSDRLFSTRYACPNCKISYEELEPRTFSFNSPYGVCPTCEGLGVREQFDPELVLPDLTLSLSSGAVAPLARRCGGDAQAPAPGEGFSGCGLGAVEHAAGGPEAQDAGIAAQRRRQEVCRHSRPVGARVRNDFERRGAAAAGNVSRARDVPGLRGARLRPEARAVHFRGKAIHEITAMAVRDARLFFESLAFEEDEQPIAEPIVGEIRSRLEFLDRLGLEYLTLDRPADSLSGGELQRVRLVSGLGSGLVGVCYILDEPSIGLHPRDNQRLIDTIRELQSRGNTVVVVEHDEAIMRQADWLIDLGPGAGRQGGRVVAQGRPADVAGQETSITGRYLSGALTIPVPSVRRRPAKTKVLMIEGVTTNNLKNVTASFPLSVLSCVTGVSGSGKSSLLNETLARALVRKLGGIAPKPGPFTALRGASRIDKVVQVDQSPIGRSPRSNPATYTGVFDEIRKVFANTRNARRLGYKAGRFSFNVKGGRCEECQGQGVQKIEMNFLPDLYLNCPVCEGRRFNRQTLEIRYKDKSIAEVLEMRVDDAARFFENFPAIARLLGSLQEVGLGYLTLGQSSITLSGGEAQRIKLATELSRTDTGNTLYILDEPTTGLHFDDTKKLLDVLGRLVDLGNTVIVIEHNLDVIKTVDWILDLGPEGGDRGGQIVAAGTPEEIAALEDNLTGRFLRGVLPQVAGPSAAG